MVHCKPHNIATQQTLDIDGDGAITVEEMRAGMKKLGTTLNPEELDQMIKDMDVDGSGTIDYEVCVGCVLHIIHVGVPCQFTTIHRNL